MNCKNCMNYESIKRGRRTYHFCFLDELDFYNRRTRYAEANQLDELSNSEECEGFDPKSATTILANRFKK